ncbi:Phosphotransferase enzyme family protein [Symmachiella macrocystis]|uniref:Phosphotransferase enzyme family protein n=2 Tax=Symmachiella macrocystis TaxID=2527985 RepID=A0A5C6BMM9_9PLAN|nr:Phosphotransferase enzyme family protein [Symmachiella macrocystis]
MHPAFLKPQASPSIMYDPAHLIEDLQQVSAYDHAADSVELIETHISWVLLAGEFAYKIKKPVDFGFVDFSTLEKRLNCCREEMRLNGRLAPQIYLEIVPAILDETSKPRLFGTGPAIEYAVKMKQFSQDALFDKMLQCGELLPRHIDALAVEVAEFHRTTDVATADEEYGGPQAVWQPVAENFRHIPASSVYPQRTEQVELLHKAAEREFHSRGAVFRRRKSTGMIRECHGDLHLGNMIVLDDNVVLFDCIEFNAGLRWIDVMSEIAFTVMDLEDRGRRDLAYRFLNAYLEQTGDYAGLEVLRYYLLYRATVRAKVAGLRLAQEPDAKARTADDQLCQSYLDLAEQYLQKPPPRIVLTRGMSGSGKSTVSQELLQILLAVRLRSDVERKRSFPDEMAVDERYSDAATAATYRQMCDGVRAAINGGFTAIADATFLSRQRRDEFRDLANELGAVLVILDVTAPDDVLRQRVAARAAAGQDVSEAGLSILERQLNQRETLGVDEAAQVIEVDTNSSVDFQELAERIHQL